MMNEESSLYAEWWKTYERAHCPEDAGYIEYILAKISGAALILLGIYLLKFL